MKTSAVILAGGRGRRLGGVNKALLNWGQETMLDRLLRICAGWTDEIVVVAGQDAEWTVTPAREHPGIAVAIDRFPGEGPLAGLHAGLSVASGRLAWVLACDQPFASAEAAALLRDRLIRDERAIAALPVLDGRLQPLHGIYRKEAAELAGDCLRRGERRVSALLAGSPWIGVEREEFERHGIAADFADDVDTPEDYARLQIRMRRGERQP